MRKLRIIVLLIILAFSFNVKAEVMFEIDCDSFDIVGDKETVCGGNLIYEDEGVNDIELSYNTNLDIKFTKVDGFTITTSNGKVMVHTDKALSDVIMNSTKIMDITLKSNSKSKEVETLTFSNIKINKTSDIVVDDITEEFNISRENEIKLDDNAYLESISVEKVKIANFDKNTFVYRDIKVSKNVVFIDAVRSSDKSSATGLGDVRVPSGETIERDITVVAEDGSKNVYKLFITNITPKEEIKLAEEVEKYPDFTDGTWNEEKINNYCSTHKLNCKINKITNTEVENGTIISQSILMGDKVESGANLEIKISDKEIVKSSDNTLKSLEVYHDNKKIDFDFNSSETEYDINIENSVSKKITIKASLNDEKASFVSGYGPRDVTFNSDDNEVIVKVKSENNDEKSYRLKIHFLKEENNGVLSIKINDKEVNLEEEKLEVRLPFTDEKTRVEVTTANESDKIDYEDIDLKVGNNPLKITITSKDNKIKEYNINVIREEEVEMFQKIEITGYNLDFSKDKTTYYLKINEETNELDIKINPSNIDFEVLNNKNLHNGSKIQITVTDKEGVYEYTIHIEKDDVKTNLICYGIFGIGIISVIVAVIIVLKKKKQKV